MNFTVIWAGLHDPPIDLRSEKLFMVLSIVYTGDFCWSAQSRDTTSTSYIFLTIVITYLWKEVYAQCVLVLFKLLLSINLDLIKYTCEKDLDYLWLTWERSEEKRYKSNMDLLQVQLQQLAHVNTSLMISVRYIFSGQGNTQW